jgi:hypothetical protein
MSTIYVFSDELPALASGVAVGDKLLIDDVSAGAKKVVAVSVLRAGILGTGASDTLGFYGTTAVSQRAAAAQATSTVGTASSTAVDTNLKAAVIEIMSTLTALGLWKGSA